MWLEFLQDDNSHMNLYRPFINIDAFTYAETLNFYSDSSLNKNFGFGAVFGDRWLFARWGAQFIEAQEPSIEYLELFALCAALITWGPLLMNKRIVIFCDNEAVVNIVNKMTLKCMHCMKLV